MIRDFIIFLWRVYRLSFQGSRLFYVWMAFLTFLTFVGAYCYARQFAHGLAITGMTDQVSWGLYIANFTFIVGLAAAAVMLVIPAFLRDPVYRFIAARRYRWFGKKECLVLPATDRQERFLE